MGTALHPINMTVSINKKKENSAHWVEKCYHGAQDNVIFVSTAVLYFCCIEFETKRLHSIAKENGYFLKGI